MLCAGLLAGCGAAPVIDLPETMALMPVAPGQSLPYGQLATACDTPEGQMGTRIDVSGQYALYDTDPGATGPRTQYVTGFNDGCARQFTAALAMFGDLEFHETMRYAQGGDYTRTDTAYETIKAQVCGVPSGQPCGGQLESLSQNTAFLTIYRAFGSSSSFGDVLLSAGEVVAADI